jgi:D-3-phosphoglycerate dehydrogenase
LLQLASQVGRLAAGISPGRIESVEVSYHGSDDDAPKPVMIAAVEGVMLALGAAPVSLINAMAVAEQRNINVERRVGRATGGFETTVGVVVRAGESSVTVVGGLLGDSEGRVVQLDGFDLDFVPRGNLLVLRNRDVPGVIGQVGLAIGEAGLNIGSYQQARSGGDGPALAAITVDHEPDAGVLEELEAIADVTEVRHVGLGS